MNMPATTTPIPTAPGVTVTPMSWDITVHGIYAGSIIKIGQIYQSRTSMRLNGISVEHPTLLEAQQRVIAVARAAE